MAKKLISVWLSMTLLLFSSTSIYAGDNVRGDFFTRDITINGEIISNYQMDDPLFLYKSTTYLPLNEQMGKILGLKIETDLESRTLKLIKTDSVQKNLSQRTQKNNRQDVKTELASGMKVLAYEAATEADASKGEPQGPPLAGKAQLSTDGEAVIPLPRLQAKKLDLRGLPVLLKGTVPYIPATALSNNGVFGWDVYYDSYTGIYISTIEGTPAKSFFNEARSQYNKGLTNYIRKYNKSYTESKALDLVFIFWHEAEAYDVDQTLLMAMAHKESTFNPSARGGGGSTGLMQVMPSTAAGMGISATQLLDPHVSIEFGARYLRAKLNDYGGNTVKALSAYNQGSGTVNRGGYSTRYATRILDTQKGLNAFLVGNGYVVGK